MHTTLLERRQAGDELLSLAAWSTIAGALVGVGLATILFSLATLAMIVGLIVAGVAMLRSGRWTGWQRLTPLGCGLFLALIVVPAFALPAYAANYAIGAWGACWLLLGLAMREPDASTI